MTKKLIIMTVFAFLLGTVSDIKAQTTVSAPITDVADEDDDESEDGDDEDGDENEDVGNDATGSDDLVLPEGMLQDLDELIKEYHARTYLRVDGDCNMRDENIEYSDSVYMERLYRMPTSIEMPYNEVVRSFIDKYSGRLRRSVSLMLGASNFYMPYFEQALESYGLPLELKYLPVIESALNPKAVSRVGATGLWQFMLTTGRQYGLRVNTLVDERCDPERASYAAAHYLRDLYRIFGDWHLVIAAYNCGPQNINKAVHRAGGVKDYWKVYPYLPSETRGYVPAFIAANYIMTYYCEHGICPMVTELPAKCDTIQVLRDVHLKQVSEVLNIDLDELRAINPMYRRDIVNGSAGVAVLRLPAEYAVQFLELEDSIYNYKADELLKRTFVEVNNDVPSYSRSSYTRSSKSKGRRGKAVSKKRRTKKSVARKSSNKRKSSSRKRRRR